MAQPGEGNAGDRAAPPVEGVAPPVVTVRLPMREVTRAGLVLIGLGLGLWLVTRIAEVLFLLFLAILFATAIEPLVNRLRRGPFTRGTGTLVVYTAVILAIGLPAFLLTPSLVQQGAAFTQSLPNRVAGLRPLAEELPPAVRNAALDAIGRAEASLHNPPTPPDEQIVEVGATAAHGIISFLTVFVLAFYWIVERPMIKRGLLRLVPRHRAREVNLIWTEVEEKLGGWVRGQLLIMLAVGIMAFLGFWLIGVPNPIVLALAAGLLEIIPVLGPFLAFAPAVVITLAVDPGKALLVLVFAIGVQQIEGNILVPRIMGHTVGISPLTVLLGILVGAALWGLPGAFLAVPVAGAIQVILSHFLHPADPVETAAEPTPMVAGTTPPPTVVVQPAAPPTVIVSPAAAERPGGRRARRRARPRWRLVLAPALAALGAALAIGVARDEGRRGD